MTDTLTSLLESQHQALSRLLHLLQQECDCLKRNAPSELEPLLSKKEEVLSQIQQLDNQLNQCADHDRQKLKSPPLNKQIDIIQDVLEQCRQQTEINRILVEKTQLANKRLHQHILATLGQNICTYDQRGNPRSYRTSKGIKA